MKAHLNILCLLAVFSGVLMESGGVFEGTVGEKVEIKCSYPDGYKYTPKYLCRHPCTSSDVLIKSAKTDQVDSQGRYSYIDIVSGRFFTVIIKDLRLTDSGVYYCGIDKWFIDKKIKVHLTVKPAPVTRPSHSTKNTIMTSIWTPTHTPAVTTSSSQQNYSRSFEQVSSTGPSQKPETPVSVPVVCAVVLLFLLFWVLMASVFLCKIRSKFLNPPAPENPVPQHSPDVNQTTDDVYHIYDEMVIDDSVIYSSVKHNNPSPLYSFITHH